MARLDGKVVLITGTGVGMGRAAALRFAAQGATVAGCDLNPETSAETVRLVRETGGTMTATAPVDLSSYDATEQWINEAADTYGGIDVLYNNASLPVVGPWDDLTVDDEWDATREVARAVEGERSAGSNADDSNNSVPSTRFDLSMIASAAGSRLSSRPARSSRKSRRA
mgnify:CR=1 FL=1